MGNTSSNCELALKKQEQNIASTVKEKLDQIKTICRIDTVSDFDSDSINNFTDLP